MRMKTMFAFFVMAFMLVGTVSAAGLSIQLKRTNPGIAGEKSAEIIFDVVNTEFTHKIEGFIWCRSPDDAVVSSTLGAGSGSGAQYVSEKFHMDTGPSQKAIALTLEADSTGDKRTGCTIKYAPYKEQATAGEKTTEDISYEGTIGAAETDVSGYKVKMVSFTAAVEETTDEETGEVITEAQAAKAKISVNEIPKEIEVGSSATISGLTVELVAAAEDSADVTIAGKLTSTSGGKVEVLYLKMNGVYAASLTDDQYREIRLDKTVPFVKAAANAEVECPEGKTSCKADEVIVVGGTQIPVIWIVAIVVVVILAVVFLLGKTSRKD
tara:strand:+ start:3666 stop:4640 length:975 start_codon:yes stop_codon:yes gene_type:complete